MGQTEWAMWANEQGVITSVVLLLGGIFGTAGQFKRWQYTSYALALGVLVLMIEYPRGKRKKGRTAERQYQTCLTYFVSIFGVLGKNYYVRFIFYLLACVPCCFALASILGGVCLLFTSLIYLRAALSGESWDPCLPDHKKSSIKLGQMSEPPKAPPPRGPLSRSRENLGCEESEAGNQL